MRFQVVDNYRTSLIAALDDSSTEIELDDDTRIPDSVSADEPLALTIAPDGEANPSLDDVEIVFVTEIDTGEGTITVTRGAAGTTAKAWESGAVVGGRLPAAIISQFLQTASVDDQREQSAGVSALGFWLTHSPQPDSGPTADGACAIGGYNLASGAYSLAVGKNAEASYAYTMALGYNTKATAWAANAFSTGNSATGWGSTAFGGYTYSDHYYTFTWGGACKAARANLMAFGGLVGGGFSNDFFGGGGFAQGELNAAGAYTTDDVGTSIGLRSGTPEDSTFMQVGQNAYSAAFITGDVVAIAKDGDIACWSVKILAHNHDGTGVSIEWSDIVQEHYTGTASAWSVSPYAGPDYVFLSVAGETNKYVGWTATLRAANLYAGTG